MRYKKRTIQLEYKQIMHGAKTLNEYRKFVTTYFLYTAL